MIRKIVKVGDSGAILLDPELEALTGWKLGDRFKVEVRELAGLVLIPLGRPKKKRKPRAC